MHRKISVVFLSLTLLAGAVAPLWAQSLADLSKKEEERRKAVKAPAKVYTNKDLGSVPPARPAPPAAAAKSDEPKAADADAKKEDDAAKPGEPVKDQAYWSNRLKGLQTQLERDQSFADALQSKINALTTDFVNRGDAAQRAIVERDRTKALAELDRLKAAILSDRKAIADFQEEARRAGVPPGWLR